MYSHFIVAVLLPTDIHLCMRETCLGFTCSAASVLGIDADVMSGALAAAGIARGCCIPEFDGAVCIVTILRDAHPFLSG